MTRVWIGIAALVAAGATAAKPAAVAFSPAPGLTLSVPKGWKACDAASEKKLGSVEDPLGLQPQICGPHQTNPDFKFGAFEPKPGQNVSIFFYLSEPSVPAVGALTPAALSELTAQRKAKSERQIAGMGATLNAFAIRKDKLGGKPALVTTVTLTPAQGAAAQVTTEKWEVPLNGHSYEISFVIPKAFAKATKPAIGTIKASVKFATVP